jgi:hypothetical protein
MSTCKCRLCNRDRNIESIKASGDIQQMRDLIDSLHDELSLTEGDLNYKTAILDGSWPQSREILERALGRKGGGGAVRREGGEGGGVGFAESCSALAPQTPTER